MRFTWIPRLFAAAALGFTLALGLVSAQADEPVKKDGVALAAEARTIHDSALVIDCQNGLPWVLCSKGDPHFDKYDIRRPQKDFKTDIPRLRKGGVGAQFFSVYVPPASAKKGTAVKDAHEQIDLVHRLAQTYPDTFEVAHTADDVVRIRRDGKIAALIGIEGCHTLDGSLSVLRQFHKTGARFITLTNTDGCDVADAGTDKAQHQGLSKFGEKVVDEMNRLGVVIDLAHGSQDTMKHALLLSRAPVIFSHAGAYALAKHPRNVPDDILKLVAKNGGVVNVNFYTAFLSDEGIKAYLDRSKAAHKLKTQYPNEKQYQLALKQFLKDNPLPAADVRTVANHIDHIVKVAGIDHVGIGSSFDACGTLPEGLEDVSCFPNLTQELLRRGYSKDDIHKILGGNMLRVLRQAEGVARSSERALK